MPASGDGGMNPAGISSALNFEGLTVQVSKDAEMAGIYRQLLQEELDRRFASVNRQFTEVRVLMDERQEDALRNSRLLQEELDRRFASGDKLNGQRHADLKELMLTGQATARDAVQAALTAAKEATMKAELATEKRLEAVNEFRSQQGDLIRSFLPRPEYAAQHAALTEKIDGLNARFAALELRLSARLDVSEGNQAGSAGQRTETRLNIGTIIAIAVFALSLVTFIILYAGKK
jgi:hypothetical protein